LKGFQRLSLKKGQSKTVSFTLKPEELSALDGAGNPKPLNGKLVISVGGSQPNDSAIQSGKAVQSAIEIL
jgi:beta-glucosidase